MEITKVGKRNLNHNFDKIAFANCYIAGGAIRDSLLGEDYSDIDVFAREKEHLDEFIEVNGDSMELLYDSEKLKTYLHNEYGKIQLIYREYSSIEGILRSFDFTICQFLYDGYDIHCNPESLLHLFNKKLVVHDLRDDFVMDSMRRMQKYIKKGYTICNGGMRDFAFKLGRLTEDQIEEQMSFYPDGSEKIIRFD